MISQIKDSLQNLGVESLDLIQLHCIPKSELLKGEVFDWLRILQSKGLIKKFGVSVETMDEAEICLNQKGLTSIQIIFNIFRQTPITQLFDKALKNGVGVIIRLLLSSGLLAGKYNNKTTFSDSDHRYYKKDGKHFNVGETFSGIKFDLGLDIVEEVRPLVPNNMSMSQFSLRWVLDHDAVTTVIAGASKLYQVDSNTTVSELEKLDEDIHLKLTVLYNDKIEKNIRGNY